MLRKKVPAFDHGITTYRRTQARPSRSAVWGVARGDAELVKDSMKERDELSSLIKARFASMPGLRRCARVRESPGKALWPTGSFPFFDAGDALTCA